VNDTPTVENPISDVTVDEDAADTLIDLSGVFGDVDSGDSLTLSIEGNTNSGLVTTNLVGTDLTLSYAADQYGSADITVRATDPSLDWIEDVFTVTVNPVNDAPTVANPIADVNVNEDAADALIDLSGVFADVDPGDSLTLSLEGNTNTGLVTTNLVGDQLTLSYAADQFGTADITIRAMDLQGDWVEDVFTVTVNPVGDIVDRHIFYNNSVLDGNDPTVNVADDAAIALDKKVLLPGGTASFANYTSYSRGINGLMVDLDELADAVTAADFEFEVNSASDPDTWVPGPVPMSVTVREDVGAGGSDRVTVVWADNAIENQWVKVTVLANANTDLADSDEFYFGSVIGDTDGDAQVDSDDYSAVLSQFGQAGSGLTADFNADGGVDFTDFAALRPHYGTSVLLPTPPAPAPQAATAATSAPLAPVVSQPSVTYDLVSTNDPLPAVPAEDIPDLLFESPGVYVSQSRPVMSDSAATVLYPEVQALRLPILGGKPREYKALG